MLQEFSTSFYFFSLPSFSLIAIDKIWQKPGGGGALQPQQPPVFYGSMF